MEKNIKKRMFALIMCVVLIVSSMSVLADDYAEIGAGNERATCYVFIDGQYAKAYTTPLHADAASFCWTTVTVYRVNGPATGEGPTYADINVPDYQVLKNAYSNHRISSFFCSLQASA